MTKVEIHTTKDYFLFSKRENVSKRLVNELVKEIKRDNYLPYCPIVVSNDFYILDGNKRYSACIELGQPIYYVVREDISCGGTQVDQTVVNCNLHKYYEQWISQWQDSEIKETLMTYKNNDEYYKFFEFLNDFNYLQPNRIGFRRAVLVYTSLQTSKYVDFHKGTMVGDDVCWNVFKVIFDKCGLTFDTLVDNFIGGIIKYIKHHDNVNGDKIANWVQQHNSAKKRNEIAKRLGKNETNQISWTDLSKILEEDISYEEKQPNQTNES